MIFVTVGTIHFDPLIQAVDAIVGERRLEGEVILQIGNGRYQPSHCPFFRTASDLAPYYDRAELVIGHGGTGTTLEVLERGIRLISVVNPDMQDNHQHEFIETLEQAGYLWYCRDLNALAELVSKVRNSEPRPRMQNHLGAAISRQFEKYIVSHSRKDSILSRWARWCLGEYRIMDTASCLKPTILPEKTKHSNGVNLMLP